ncbi:hypothetical protein [Tateyamaria omphalii]|uniref:hypothetical protein n=1 Tax=Tateyamaria omphalii TaxID=299262 RepID=UPI00167A8A5E|nr:hypothetical protein [Tateyamaria omphalii]
MTKSEAEENGWFVVSAPPSQIFLWGGVSGMAAGVIAAMRQYCWGKTPQGL